ncbi:unnamed protein product, partial [Porites lobata]
EESKPSWEPPKPGAFHVQPGEVHPYWEPPPLPKALQEKIDKKNLVKKPDYKEAIRLKPGDKNPLLWETNGVKPPVNRIENDGRDPYWNPQAEIPFGYYGVQPVPVQYQQFPYNPAVQQGWAGGIQLQPGHAPFMQPYWTTTTAQQQYAAQQQFAAMQAQQYATQQQQVAAQQQQVATEQQNDATPHRKVATKHQQGPKQQQDEEKKQEEKTCTTKTIEKRLEDMKQTLDKEREEFSLKLKRQSRRVSDLEIKDKQQQNEKTERDLSKAQERILNLEADNEAQRRKLEKFTDELSQEFSALRATYNELQERLRVEERTTSQTIHGLKDEYEMLTKVFQTCRSLILNRLTRKPPKSNLGIANQEQRSLAQRCELWKKSSHEKDLVCERAEKDKAVLSEKIQSEKAAKIELQENNETLRVELAASKKQNVLLMQEVELLKEQNYNLRYYGGVIGKFRRMKRFIVNTFRRFSS